MPGTAVDRDRSMELQAITLLCSDPSWIGVNWTADATRIHRAADFDELVAAITRRAHQFHPIERVIIEGTLNSLDYLMFLSTLPADFTADVMLIDSAKHGFLSAFDGRSERLLYDLDGHDIAFYVDVHKVRAATDRTLLETGLPPKRLRALIADDDVTSRNFLSAALTDLGCEVLLARTGTEAVRMAAEHRPGILVLDGLMPEIGGFEASRFIRSIDTAYQPRIVIATAVYKNIRYQNEARLKYGVDAYLVKPMTVQQLATALFGNATELASAVA